MTFDQIILALVTAPLILVLWVLAAALMIFLWRAFRGQV